jgi:hypothetical protein
MCGTNNPRSCIRWVLGFGLKTGYDIASPFSLFPVSRTRRSRRPGVCAATMSRAAGYPTSSSGEDLAVFSLVSLSSSWHLAIGRWSSLLVQLPPMSPPHRWVTVPWAEWLWATCTTVQAGHVGLVQLGCHWIRPVGLKPFRNFQMSSKLLQSCKVCANLNSSQKILK